MKTNILLLVCFSFLFMISCDDSSNSVKNDSDSIITDDDFSSSDNDVSETDADSPSDDADLIDEDEDLLFPDNANDEDEDEPCAAGQCYIEGACYDNGAVNPQHPCLECNFAENSLMWSLKASGVACRAASGLCDIAEVCDGVNNDCPEDSVAENGFECREAHNGCDVSEFCDGSAKECPEDLFLPEGTLCRDSEGVCDAQEFCTGESADCPEDLKLTTECRAAQGDCDAPEFCDGVNNECPEDLKLTTECRAAQSDCNIADFCDGASNDCPPDYNEPAGTLCTSDGNLCNGSEVCDGAGACTHGNDVICNSGSTCIPSTGLCANAVSCTNSECYLPSATNTCPVSGEEYYGQDYNYASLGYCIPKNFETAGTNDEPTVKDKNANLEWQLNVSSSVYSFTDASLYCSNLVYAGYNDWTLPSDVQLNTIIDFGKADNALDSSFSTVPSATYWSSRQYVGDASVAFAFNLTFGDISGAIKTAVYKAMCVRGSYGATHTFTSEGVAPEIVLTDSVTGMKWRKEYTGDLTWKDAIKHCEDSSYGGYSDWRLPNINELRAIVDRSVYQPALQPEYNNLPGVYFWSSTTAKSNSNNAWLVHMKSGSSVTLQKTNLYYTVCVR